MRRTLFGFIFSVLLVTACGSSWFNPGTSGPVFANAHSIDFAAANSNLNGGNVAALSPSNTQAFSGSCWVKRGAAGSQVIMGKVTAVGASPSLTGWYFSTDGSTLNLYVGNLGTGFMQVNSGAVTSVGTWYFMGFTYDGSKMGTGIDFYLNSTRTQGTGGLNTVGSTTNSADFIINGYVGGLYGTGKTTKCSFWNVKQNSSFMAGVYNSGTPLDETGSANLITNWWMGDGDTLPTILGHALYDLTAVSGAVISTDHP